MWLDEPRGYGFSRSTSLLGRAVDGEGFSLPAVDSRVQRKKGGRESQNEKPSLPPQEHVLLAISLIQGQIFKKHDSCSYYLFIFFRM